MHRVFASNFKINDIRNFYIDKFDKSLNHKRINSFKIIRVANNVIYKFKLFNSIKIIHNVFYF